jgi:SAM-dependent methyltransferase
MNDVDSPKHYFIRPDYVPNVVRTTAPEQAYWTPKRIESSRLFQYHVYQRAAELLSRKAGARVLDIGCGTARKAVELLIPRSGRYIGLDQGSAVEYCKKTVQASNAEFLVDDLENPTPRPGQFDLVVCADVIEHLGAPEKLLGFALAALAPGGRFIISTPERDVMRGPGALRSPNPDHVREWNRTEFRKLLAAHGFAVDRLTLTPQFRIPLSRNGLRLLRTQLHRPAAYWGCQMAICTRK